MSIFNIFSGKQTLHQHWIELTELKALDRIIKESTEKPVVLFKHSTTCSRSAFAKHRLESEYDIKPEEASFYYLDLLSYRPISNAIAERFGVRHQSPQVIVVKNGKAVFDTSHESISLKKVKQAIAN